MIANPTNAPKHQTLNISPNTQPNAEGELYALDNTNARTRTHTDDHSASVREGTLAYNNSALVKTKLKAFITP